MHTHLHNVHVQCISRISHKIERTQVVLSNSSFFTVRCLGVVTVRCLGVVTVRCLGAVTIRGFRVVTVRCLGAVTVRCLGAVTVRCLGAVTVRCLGVVTERQVEQRFGRRDRTAVVVQRRDQHCALDSHPR